MMLGMYLPTDTTLRTTCCAGRRKIRRFACSRPRAAQCDYNYISHAIGIGVRYKTPVGPVRFDFGYNLNPPAFPGQTVKDDQTVFDPKHASHFNVFFSIGQTF